MKSLGEFLSSDLSSNHALYIHPPMGTWTLQPQMRETPQGKWGDEIHTPIPVVLTMGIQLDKIHEIRLFRLSIGRTSQTTDIVRTDYRKYSRRLSLSICTSNSGPVKGLEVRK